MSCCLKGSPPLCWVMVPVVLLVTDTSAGCGVWICTCVMIVRPSVLLLGWGWISALCVAGVVVWDQFLAFPSKSRFVSGLGEAGLIKVARFCVIFSIVGGGLVFDTFFKWCVALIILCRILILIVKFGSSDCSLSANLLFSYLLLLLLLRLMCWYCSCPPLRLPPFHLGW